MEHSFRSLNPILIHAISRSRGVDFGIPTLISGDLPLFGSEFSDPPDPILGEVHAEFSWARCVLTRTVVTFGSYILGTLPRCLLVVRASIGTSPVVSLMSWIILLNGLESKTVPAIIFSMAFTMHGFFRFYLDALNFTRTDKIINPSHCNPCDFALSMNLPTGSSPGVASLGTDRHVISRLMNDPVVFIFTGFLSKVSHLVDLLHKNAGTSYPVTVVCQVALEVPQAEFQLFMSFTSYLLNHHQHPDNTRMLTLQLLPPTEGCSWSSIVFAAPHKGAARGGSGAQIKFVPTSCISGVLQLKAREKKTNGRSPVYVRSFEDGSRYLLRLSVFVY